MDQALVSLISGLHNHIKNLIHRFAHPRGVFVCGPPQARAACPPHHLPQPLHPLSAHSPLTPPAAWLNSGSDLSSDLAGRSPCVRTWVQKDEETVPVFKDATPWTVCSLSDSYKSMGFSKQEYWSGLPFPPSGDLPNPGADLSLTSFS